MIHVCLSVFITHFFNFYTRTSEQVDSIFQAVFIRIYHTFDTGLDNKF